MAGTRWRTLCAPTALVLLLAVSGEPALLADSEKEEAREKIQVLLDGKEWKDAAKKLKAYLRVHAQTEGEKGEIAYLLGKARSHVELDKIAGEYRRKEKPRSTARRVARFIQEHLDYPELLTEAEELRDVARSEYVLLLEDFEDLVEKGKKKRRHETPVTDPVIVKHGRKACRWSTEPDGYSSHSMQSPEKDWTGYDFFCAWIYTEEVPEIPLHIRVELSSIGADRFSYLLAIDWKGWKEIRLPLRGASGFSKIGKPSWETIGYVFMKRNDRGRPTEIIIDDIRLEKSAK